MGKKEIRPMFHRFRPCEEFNYKLNLYSLADFSQIIGQLITLSMIITFITVLLTTAKF